MRFKVPPCNIDQVLFEMAPDPHALNGSILRGVPMLLVLAVCCGKPPCNYKEIHHTYRDIVLVELHRLAHHVLRSIYSLTRRFRCHSVGERPERDLEKPVDSMEHLLTQHCSRNLVKKDKVCGVRRTRGKRRRRLQLLGLLRTLLGCWQKFQSIVSQNLSKD
ncbi:hypothetical protein NHX12_012332 [Muraenolepis orangiensis]|uniref:Uncharacterized protein n=1 Tax=Muraenolepis orangiensis TaxID=630683 RepID=A0A9Q0I5E0_9TELE|nr:hypothetical protein NHX12_012332 [Muraenolepis orangiensis]